MRHILLILPVLMMTGSCTSPGQEGEQLFSSLSPAETGVRFNNKLKESEEFNIIEYLYFNNGGGVAAGDINNDGLADLYFTSSQGADKLFLNRGGLAFEEISEQAGITDEGDWKTGVTMADVNGDALLDIYVCQVGDYKGLTGRNRLYINNGDLSFSEQAVSYGLDFRGFSTQAAFFDYDGDGDLDMYLLNHSVHTSRSYGGAELRYESDPRAGDRLYRNELSQGRRFFQDVSAQAGILSSQIGYGLGVCISDLDNNGHPDVYVSNDFHEIDYAYMNRGDGTFREGFREMFAHASRSSMGNDAGDINNDGRPDVVVLDMLPEQDHIRKASGGEDEYELFMLKLRYGYYHQFVRNTLQLNLGGGLFSEIGRLAGIHATDWSWAPLLCDVDNDGYRDIFITNGIYRRANDLDYIRFLTGGNRYFPRKDNDDLPDKVLYEKMPLYPHVNFIFRNNRDLSFTNMADQWGFHERSFSNGAACADLDNDGDLDLVVNNINQDAFVMRNNARQLNTNHYLSVALKGNEGNPRGTGARVVLYCRGEQLMAEQFATRGFLSSVPDVLHFGLGQVSVIDSLMVRWPCLREEWRYEVAADRLITLNITDARGARSDCKGISSGAMTEAEHGARLFTKVDVPGLTHRHHENSYVDIMREQLIPHNLSAEGPASAAGDINGDGLDDLFVGGSGGRPAVMLQQQSNGSFIRLTQPVLLNDRLTEDVDAAFFDADADGDLDLYVVRGGNEFMQGDPITADRLLINDGTGLFEKPPRGALPYLANNGSCVCPADFDGDGDTDLFVGSRSVPGAYGLTPMQVLLENDGKGMFEQVTARVSMGLEEAGMVTDAAWLDHDSDGDPDLVVVGQWMKVTLYRNEGGQLDPVSDVCGLDHTEGWWYSIHVADLDGDGDMDMIGGNLGRNSILKASREEPVQMYVNDFDNNGLLDQVVCAYENGTSYPVASLDELIRQMPELENSYPEYAGFGGQTITDMFGEEKVSQSLVRKAVMMETCAFLNRGDGTFTARQLPVEVQFAPVRAVLADDVNGDGFTDLVLAGNDYSARPSLGRYDASYGWCLLGAPGPRYRVLLPAGSGLKIRGDARAIRTLEASGRSLMVAVINNDSLQVFRY